MKALLIEANKIVVRSLTNAFREQSCFYDHVSLGLDGVDLVITKLYSYDIVVVGSHLQDITNIAALKLIRRAGVSTPVIIILETYGKAIEVLDLGADDCMIRPINVYELLARMRAIMRRPKEYKTFIDLGRLTLNRTDRQVRVDGRDVHLSKTEFVLLELLALRSKHLVLNDTLVRYTTGHDTLKVHIYNLRIKLGKGFISTVWGQGHILNKLEKL